MQEQTWRPLRRSGPKWKPLSIRGMRTLSSFHNWLNLEFKLRLKSSSMILHLPADFQTPTRLWRGLVSSVTLVLLHQTSSSLWTWSSLCLPPQLRQRGASVPWKWWRPGWEHGCLSKLWMTPFALFYCHQMSCLLSPFLLSKNGFHPASAGIGPPPNYNM